jgi:DNA-binding GntR family transcriptional regulator
VERYGGSMPTNTTRTYDELRAAILSGELRPGQPLRTAALAERYGTSRTPVREALVILEGEGLVALEPRRGAVVRSFGHKELYDLYELRALIEPRAVELAAERITDGAFARLGEILEAQERTGGRDKGSVERQVVWNAEFHRLLIESSGSRSLLDAARGIGAIPNALRTAFYVSDYQRSFSLACHREIYEAIAIGSGLRAAAAMRIHLLSGKDYLSEVMRDDAGDATA